MISHQQNSSAISSKKEKFRRQIRAEYLQNYMSKIRTQMHDSQQYKVLRNIIDSIYNIDNFNNQNEKNMFRLQKVKQLISFANQGKNVAIVAIGQLLLSNIITINMIETIPIEDFQNSLNSNNFIQKNDLMGVIRFPQQNQNNQGWLAFIRILVNLSYCTQEMILYCIKTIAKNKSLQSLEFALQVIYILLIDKKMVKIQEISQLILDEKSSHDKTFQNNLQQKILIENYLDSLMKFSLKSNNFQENSQIHFYASKILEKSFSNEKFFEIVIIKNVTLSKIMNFLQQKFLIQSIRQKAKALKITNDLLVRLKDFYVYNVDQIFEKGLLLLKKIVNELLIISTNLIQKKQGQLGYSHKFSPQKISEKSEKDIVGFIEEAIYFIQIIVENYLFTHNSVSITNQILESLTIQLLLENFFILFDYEINQQRNSDSFFDRDEFENSLTGQEKVKIWIVENVITIARNIDEKLTNSTQSLSQNSKNFDPSAIKKFITLSNLIVSRIRQSRIGKRIYQDVDQNDYQI